MREVKTKIQTIAPPSTVRETIPPQTKSDPTHDEISKRARALWHEKGCPEGQSEMIWLEAEEMLRGRLQLKADDDRGFADPQAPMDDDGEPSGWLEQRLRDATSQSSARSATSL
jgi:hypothetical protein